MLQDGKYAAKIDVWKLSPEPWESIKQRLCKLVFREVYFDSIGDEKYHVFYSKFFKDEYDIDKTSYYLEIRHSLAHIQNFVIPSLFEPVPKTAKPICSSCGNVLILDKRGGCSGCGAPAGKDYNNGLYP